MSAHRSARHLRWMIALILGTITAIGFSRSHIRGATSEHTISWTKTAAWRDTGTRDTSMLDIRSTRSRADLMAQENGSCPELLAASRFAMTPFAQTLPQVKIAMVQLVGRWNEEQKLRTMRHVFSNNEKICARLGIPAYSIASPVNRSDDRPPPFWKMQAVKQTCETGRYDVVWFLDGDVLITEPTIPVEALWVYHANTKASDNSTMMLDDDGEMDFLFSIDWNGLNSGIFLVNCRSVSAMDYLDQWDKLSQDYVKYYPVWYEQNFVHYTLNTSHFWTNIRRFNRQQEPPDNDWDDRMLPDDNHSLWSTQALRRRLRSSDTQCAFTRYPVGVMARRPLAPYRREYGQYEKGEDVSVHTASLRDQFPFMTRLLQELSTIKPTFPAGRNITRTEIVWNYLETHDREKKVAVG